MLTGTALPIVRVKFGTILAPEVVVPLVLMNDCLNLKSVNLLNLNLLGKWARRKACLSYLERNVLNYSNKKSLING